MHNYSIVIDNLYNFLQEVVITVEGNMLATDGDQKFTASIDNGTDYIVGGTFGGNKYYTSLQIVIEEDDGRYIVEPNFVE